MRSPCTKVTRVLALVLVCAGAAMAAAAPALAEDIDPPAVTAFSITPSHVDTSSAQQSVTAELTAQDTQSGVTSVVVQLHSELSQQWVQADAELVSGDAASGEYRARLSLPSGSMSGVWHATVCVTDQIGNLAALPWFRLDLLFGAGVAAVTNDAGAWDSAPPQATAVHVSPATIDTSETARTVSIAVTVTDDLSGVSSAFGWLRSSRSEQAQYIPLTRTSGDGLHGEFEGLVTLPRYSASGEWGVYLFAQDNVGNNLGGSLAEAFGDAATTTNDAALEDVTPPQLTALSIAPAVFDTEAGAQELTVTAQVTDDLAGVSDLLVYVRPLLSYQYHVVELKPVSGTGLDCLLSGTVTLPQGAEVGPWMSDVELHDALRNTVRHSPDQLAALLPGSTGITLVNTAEAQQVTVRKEWELTGESSSITFPVGTVVTRSEGGSFAFYQMVAQPFDFTAELPTEDLQGTPVATLRFGIPGLGLTFSQPVAVRMRVGDEYDGYLVRIQSLEEDGQVWAKETEALVTGGWAQFSVGHATRFVAAPARARVTKVTPRRCRRRARVTITGAGFGETRGRSAVVLGGRVCRTCTRWTPRSVTFVVPRSARLGRLRLSVRVHGAITRAGTLTVRR